MSLTDGKPRIGFPKPAQRLASVTGNVWLVCKQCRSEPFGIDLSAREWMFKISDLSPLQPIANLGHGTMFVNRELKRHLT